jgi:PPM family protein phosphatase
LVRFDVYTASNSIGSGHSENQDSYLADVSTMLFAVADGVGGYEGGKEASELAIAALRSNAAVMQNETLIKSTLEEVNEQLIHTAKIRHKSNMGTTIALAKIFPNFQTGFGGKVITANVGDSPIMLFANDQTGYESESFTKVYTDDSFRGDNPGSMWAITQYLGIESQEVKIHIQSFDFQNGDVILICSDGVSDNLLGDNTYSRGRGVGDIEELVRRKGSAREIVEESMRAGIKRDDMTALLVFL